MSTAAPRKRTHYLHLAVIAAVVLGIVVGAVAPHVGVQMKPLGTGFVLGIIATSMLGSLTSGA